MSAMRAPAEVHDWSMLLGGTANEVGYATAATDPEGGIVVVGTFDGNTSIGGSALSSKGLTDVFLAKFSERGGLIWAKSFGGQSTDQPGAMAIDPSTGEIFVAGRFSLTVNFGGTTLTSAGGSDAFLAKFSSTGALRWALKLGGQSNDWAAGLAVTGGGDVYATGTFRGSMGCGGESLNSGGGSDVFLARFSSSGSTQWCRRMGGTRDDVVEGLAIDANDRLIIVGAFDTITDLGGETLESAGLYDLFLASYLGTDGSHRWSYNVGGSGYESADAVVTDGNDFVVAGYFGLFGNAVDFGDGSPLSSTGGADAFVAKYAIDDGSLRWVEGHGGTADEHLKSVAVDPSGNIVVVGDFQGTTNFGGGALTSGGQNDVIAARYSSTGAHLWSQRFGSLVNDKGFGITIDANGDTILTGFSIYQINFGGGILNSAGQADAFLVKFTAGEPTPPSTPTSSPTHTPLPTTVPSPTRTATWTPLPTATPSWTRTLTQTPTRTSVPTATPSWTPTRTLTHTPTRTSVPTATPSWTPTRTLTHTPTRTSVPTATPSWTPTRTLTHTPTRTATMAPTQTPTNTGTRTATSTSSRTPTRTATLTFTQTPSTTATRTRTQTASPTATTTNTPPNTATRTASHTPVPSSTPTLTRTFTSSPLPTLTPTRTNTRTASSTATRTYTPLPTATTTPTPDFWPPTVSGMVLWLDAAQISGVLSGASIATWFDASGSGHHATQSTSANRPTYQGAAANGQPAIRFDGTNDHLVVPSVITGAQARTIFVVGRPTLVGNRGFIDLGNGSTPGQGFMLSPEYGVRVNGGNVLWNPAATAGTTSLYVVQLNGTTTSTVSAWVDGAALNLTSQVAATIDTAGSGTVGGWTASPVGANCYSGDLAEIIVYNRALTVVERQNLEQFLADKYSLSWQGANSPTATLTATNTIPPTATATPPPLPTSTRTATATVPTPTASATSSPAPPTPTLSASGPGAIAGLALWLDASQITGASEGGVVGNWSDASGYARHATQVATASRPLYSGNGLNGLPALRFDGVDDYLNLPDNIVAGSQARTVFFVARPEYSLNRGIVDLGDGSTAGGGFLITPEFGARIDSLRSSLWFPPASTQVPTLGVVLFSGTQVSDIILWVDGEPRIPISVLNGAVLTNGAGAVGTSSASPIGSHNFQGEIAEIIVYGRALDGTERQGVEQYLAAKYGLSGLTATATPSSTSAAPPTATRTPTLPPPDTATPLPSSTPTASPSRTPTATSTGTPTLSAPTPTPTTNAALPQTVPDLELWLDAGTIAGNEGDAVSTWSDASGQGHHGTQASSEHQPVYRGAGLNGLPAVRFDGIDDHLTLAGSIVSGSQPRTVFVVGKPLVVGNRGFIDLGNGSTLGGGFMLSPEFAVRVSGGNAIWNPAATAATAVLYSVKLTGGTTEALAAWVNGTPLTSTSVASAPIQTTGNATVGGWTAAAAGGNNFNGDIAEIIVYSRALSSLEQQAVEHYLSAKYFSAGPEPGAIAGLQLWLDAGSLSALNSGARVETWPDASSAAHLVTQPSVASQPSFQPDALNGMPAVRFDGSDDYLSFVGPVVSGAEARTIIWVGRPSAIGNRGLIDLGRGSTLGSAFLVTPEHGVRVMGGNRLWSLPPSTTNPTIGVVSLSGGTTNQLTAWMNGTSLPVSGGTTAVAIQTSGPGAIGAWSLSPIGPNNFEGDIGELLVYDRALSDNERRMVEQSLAIKYGIPIT